MFQPIGGKAIINSTELEFKRSVFGDSNEVNHLVSMDYVELSILVVQNKHKEIILGDTVNTNNAA